MCNRRFRFLWLDYPFYYRPKELLPQYIVFIEDLLNLKFGGGRGGYELSFDLNLRIGPLSNF